MRGPTTSTGRTLLLLVGVCSLGFLGAEVFSSSESSGLAVRPLTSLNLGLAALSLLLLALRPSSNAPHGGGSVGSAAAAAEEELHARENSLALHLAQMDRVNALGRMASSLAHELNQPLFAIGTRIGAARIGLERGQTEGLEKDLEAIAEQTSRAGEILRRIQRFVREREHEREEIDPDDIVERTVEFLQHDASRRGIRLVPSLGASAPVSGDEILLQQVLMNLVRNAMDAVEELGPERRIVRLVTLPSERGTRFLVEDSGTGLSQEDPEEVFQPFRSTKAEGMGLGLSISRSIVESHDSRLTASRTSGGGATFWFELEEARRNEVEACA